ncbi:MAG: lipid-A-disaccharide synthase [Nitrospinae bacterium RIFCSPLOWO2_02_FULL_39_110]|nr:MAG: lipid-A-disaccharide synthase [Nitrospinae bacterium RIFCSPHIGHO2_12_FULL_39_42]OGV98540.1 MAG: lipid-A-disaccharide synthase [Nitrospinae bacterium RIFCSPHIGHO2_02_39_11]OGV99706.1 MAG: lipid-A-disaccharide synthase [Nitrospinae bacterium RIFCSPHIGHO2_02_FULL_39_82]OGW01274.1 MAG: lipid-A-disaccharide synthase [Nitrospinae bacterium RIFCSPLOWO2_02_39_17]OGW03756.1 MAG: lipid-A-disaccharide synthase [Nitrospinae bacterium RIFCSPLOWO2_02_FULL_39_110]OGW08783.1 MAG: lipid-A-disaccharide 
MSYELLIITGEDSGDLYGGNLAKEIQRLSPDINISGVGGRRMRSAGVDIFCDVSDISVVGFWEVIEKLGLIRRLYKQVVERLDSGNVKGVVLIDYPGFNLKVAKAAKERGIPVFYYISPQVWAWRKSRVKTIKKYVDKIMVILPFEKEFYKKEGVDVEFVGHPLLEVIPPPLQGGELGGREEICRELGVDDKKLIIGILPGSRKKEIAYMLPPILKASSLIKEKYPSTQFLLPLSSSVDENYLKDFITSEYSHIKHYRGKNYDVMKVSDLLITKSGTSTLEAAIIGTPMMVIYKSSFISFCLAKILVYLSYAGLPNLLAGREIAPELIQFGANPGNIAEKAMYFLKDQNRLNQMKEELKKVKHSLGEPGASKKVAWIIIEYLKNSTN